MVSLLIRMIIQNYDRISQKVYMIVTKYIKINNTIIYNKVKLQKI